MIKDKKFNDLVALVVEDNLGAQKLLRMILKDIGITQIFSANDGKEALSFLDSVENKINLVICDWNMPNVTGISLLKQLRAVNSDIPFLMVTARADADSVLSAKKFGVSAYITKPFTPDHLEQKIKSLIPAALGVSAQTVSTKK